MSKMYQLSTRERELFFRSAAEKISIPFELIEKDYWVVWTLERLHSIDEIGPKLTFKGWTSLSKVYNVIHRFSEDIDLSIEGDCFGVSPLSIEQAPSKKKMQQMIENLSKECSKFVQTRVLNLLKESITEKLGFSEEWEVYSDETDPSFQTLLFRYPSHVSKAGYVRPIVKIEMGARSEHWPVEKRTIQSYTKQALPESVEEESIEVRVLSGRRTFWEKATILHQYSHLPEHKTLPLRLSRHFYDFFCLLNSDIRGPALENSDLLSRVANHKSLYFSSKWASYDTARKGMLRLIPPERIRTELRKDYELMKTMLFREVPEWESIMDEIKEFEYSFNAI